MLSSLMMVSCLSKEEIEFERAQKANQTNQFEKAVEHFKKVIDISVDGDKALVSAREAARILHYELKRYDEAISFYRHTILYGKTEQERILAQKKVADIYFNQLTNYTQAITEYSRLLDLPHSHDDGLTYRLVVARSYFYLNNFFQAQTEIGNVIADHPPEELHFEALVLRSNIYLATKDYKKAEEVLLEILNDFPQRSKTQNISLNLAVAYEEQSNFAKAIETLESLRESYPRREFIDQRIKNLKERQSYLPGAKGWRK